MRRNLMPILALPVLLFAAVASASAQAAKDEEGSDGPVPQSPDPANVLVETEPLPAPRPELGEIVWIEPPAHCLYHAPDITPDASDPASWRLRFLTIRAGDDQVTMERGYAMIDGLLRELRHLGHETREGGSTWRYATFGAEPISVTLDRDVDTLEKDGTAFKGTLTLKRGDVSVSHLVAGRCNPTTANKRAKS